MARPGLAASRLAELGKRLKQLAMRSRRRIALGWTELAD